jgi:hypothetical protein
MPAEGGGRYQLHGIVLDSARVLPTLPRALVQGPADVSFSLAAEPPEKGRRLLYVVPALAPLGTAPTPFLSISLGERYYCVDTHGHGDFFLHRSGESIVYVDPRRAPVDQDVVEQLLVDQVLPRAMQLLGRPCLHASAIVLDALDGALALLGPSASGKSTLAAALSQAGALLSDDCVASECRPDGVWAYPGYPSIRLWPNAAAAVEGSTEGLPVASQRAPKLRVRRPAAGCPVKLRRLVLLEPGAVALARQRLTPGAAALALPLGVHRLDLTRPDLLRCEFALLTALARHVEVVRLRFRHDLSQLEALLAAVTTPLDAI